MDLFADVVSFCHHIQKFDWEVFGMTKTVNGAGEAELGSDAFIESSKSGRAGAGDLIPSQLVCIGAGCTPDRTCSSVLPRFNNSAGLLRY